MGLLGFGRAPNDPPSPRGGGGSPSNGLRAVCAVEEYSLRKTLTGTFCEARVMCWGPPWAPSSPCQRRHNARHPAWSSCRHRGPSRARLRSRNAPIRWGSIAETRACARAVAAAKAVDCVSVCKRVAADLRHMRQANEWGHCAEAAEGRTSDCRPAQVPLCPRRGEPDSFPFKTSVKRVPQVRCVWAGLA